MKLILSIILGLCFINTNAQSYLYSQSSTPNTWSYTQGGPNCGCSPSSTDTVDISHNWANPSFYPITAPGNIAFGTYLSVNPFKVIVRNGGVVYQQPNLTTGMVLEVNDGGFWGYNGSLVLDGVEAASVGSLQNDGTILVNGSYINRIAVNSPGEFCKNGSWLNDVSAPGTFNGAGDANMDPYFTLGNYGASCLDHVALPVELISFTANNSNDVTTLNWQTASEINNSHFNIQRSSDGLSWETIGYVEGSGNSVNVLSYSYEDAHGVSGVCYYRLLQVDFDGSSEYSNIITVDNLGKFNIYPNPSSGEIYVNYPYNNESVLKIFDMKGSLVFQYNIKNSEKLPIDYLDNGIYNVILKSSIYVTTKRLVIQK